MGTTTTNYDLYKPDVGEVGWADEVNTNFDTLDALLTSQHYGIQYVAYWGDDANDGRTWETAKLTVTGAIEEMSSGGKIYVATSDDFVSPDESPRWAPVATNANVALWIVGPNDPNFASPPTGFIAIDAPFSIEAVSLNPSGDNIGGSDPVGYIAGGSGTDASKPAIWISGTNKPISFRGFRCVGLAQPMKLGIQSDDETVHTNTAMVAYRNCYFRTTADRYARATVQVGYAFWVWFEGCSISCTPYAQSVTAAAVGEGTVYTFTVTSTSHLEVGDTVNITGSSVSGYNGLWDVTEVPGSTTFKADIGTNPAAFSGTATMRLLIGDARAAIATLGTTGQPNAGLIRVTNTTFAGGGFRYKVSSATGWGEVTLENVVHEGDFTNEEPPTFDLLGVPQSTSSGGVVLKNVSGADGFWTKGLIRTTATSDPSVVTAIGCAVTGGYIRGPHINIGSRINSLGEGPVLGIPMGFERRIHGATSHQTGGMAAARYANLAPQTASGWSSATGSATVTPGIADPYGGTNAATLSGASPLDRQPYRATRTVNVGDWFVVGCWVRAPNLWSSANPVTVSLNGAGYTLDSTVAYFGMKLERISDNDWRWISFATKVIAVGGGSAEVILALNCQSGYPVTYAFPVLNHIPVASGLSIADIREYTDRLEPYSNSLTAGEVGPPHGMVTNAVSGLAVGDGGTIAKVLTASTTYDPANMILDGSAVGTTLTVTGAAVGDPCFAGLTTLTTEAVLITAHVTATNTVRVDLLNKSGGALDLGSGTLKVTVFQNA